jgi:hypothetical protein
MNVLTMIRTGLFAGVLALAVACGGTPATSPAQTPAGPGTTVAPGGQPTPAGQQPGAGVQDPCGLATVEEVSAALGVDVMTAEPDTGGDTTYCNYRAADGTSLLATSYSVNAVNSTVFRSFAGAEDAVPVPGLADEAVISGGVLYIRLGEAMVGIQPSRTAIQDVDEQQLVQMLTTLGQSVAGRL